VLNYTMFCLAALFLLVVCLAPYGLEWWCVVPSLIGSLTLLTNWNLGPPMVLLSIAGLLGMASPRYRGIYWPGSPRFQMPTVMDLLMCVAVLAYVLGHYRLLSLTRNIFPLDPRRKRGDPKADPSQRRSPDLVSGREMVLVGFVLPVCVGLAMLVWTQVMASAIWGELPFGIPWPMWRALQVIWGSLAALAVVGIVATFLRWMTATPEESLLYLQDQIWRQTRREQSSLNRWLAWARLRAQRKKESS
jgi:hypothetical protein